MKLPYALSLASATILLLASGCSRGQAESADLRTDALAPLIHTRPGEENTLAKPPRPDPEETASPQTQEGAPQAHPLPIPHNGPAAYFTSHVSFVISNSSKL